MPIVLVLLFLVVPLVELYVLIQVGQQIGVLPTLALLVVDALLGAWLFKREGRRAWLALTEAIGAHRMPAREVADGALVVVGGAFLLTPGFLSDLVGVLCLLPPTRALLRRALTGLVARRLLGVPASALRGGPSYDPGVAGGSGTVIEGEVLDSPDSPDGRDDGRGPR